MPFTVVAPILLGGLLVVGSWRVTAIEPSVEGASELKRRGLKLRGAALVAVLLGAVVAFDRWYLDTLPRDGRIDWARILGVLFLVLFVQLTMVCAANYARECGEPLNDPILIRRTRRCVVSSIISGVLTVVAGVLGVFGTERYAAIAAVLGAMAISVGSGSLVMAMDQLSRRVRHELQQREIGGTR